MKIIIQLLIIALSLLLTANADEYCDNLLTNLIQNCNASMLTPKSCSDFRIFPRNKALSGVYKIKTGLFETADVYCDMDTDGGGWTVIQRKHTKSTENFNRKWMEYEEGFGDLRKDFWYGLKAMNCFTQNGQWEMRVDFQHTNGTWSYMHYKNFSVGSANDEYPLTIGGFTGVTPTDKFAYLNGMKFTTYDNDNDKWSGNCAVSYPGGWWSKSCFPINLNREPAVAVGPIVASAEMKIRPKNCITQ